MARPVKRRKRGWHLKPAAKVLILILIILIIVVVCVSCFLREGTIAPSSESGAVSSETQTGGEPQNASSISEPDVSAPVSEPTASLPEIPAATEVPYGSFGAGKLTMPAETGGDFLYTDGAGTEYTLPYEAFLRSLPEGSTSDWNLILLNPEENNKIDRDLDIDMTKFDTQWVDTRAADAYQAMYDAALAADPSVTLYLRSGYRSISTQQTNYNNNIQRLIGQGVNEAEAIRQTQMYYTVPGHSEHHTGLAFDIITPEYHTLIYTLDERFGDTDAYKWLIGHASDYGFVLRYAKDKEEMTQISFEPWHYRYAGKEHAKFMQKYNLCFEEYVKLLQMRDALKDPAA